MKRPDLDIAAFASRLHMARRRSGMTVPDAAAACGIPLPTLEAYLYRQHLPNTRALFRLALGLGVSSDWLLFGDPGAMVAPFSDPRTQPMGA